MKDAELTLTCDFHLGRYRFLFMNDETSLLLRMHQRYQLHLSGRPSSEARDLKSLFPQLVLFLHNMSSTAKLTLHEPPLHITIYRSVSLPTLLRVCPYRRSSYINHVSIFGSYYLPMQEEQQPLNPFEVVDIVGMTLKRGAYIKRPAEVQDMSRWRPCCSAGTRFLLEMDDDLDLLEAADMVKLAMHHLRVVSRSKHVLADTLCLELDLRCNSSSLEDFIHIVSQPIDTYPDIANPRVNSCQDSHSF